MGSVWPRLLEAITVLLYEKALTHLQCLQDSSNIPTGKLAEVNAKVKSWRRSVPQKVCNVFNLQMCWKGGECKYKHFSSFLTLNVCSCTKLSIQLQCETFLLQEPADNIRTVCEQKLLQAAKHDVHVRYVPHTQI